MRLLIGLTAEPRSLADSTFGCRYWHRKGIRGFSAILPVCKVQCTRPVCSNRRKQPPCFENPAYHSCQFCLALTAEILLRLAYLHRLDCYSSHGKYLCRHNNPRPYHSELSQLRTSCLPWDIFMLGRDCRCSIHQYRYQRFITHDRRIHPGSPRFRIFCCFDTTCLHSPAWNGSRCLQSIVE